MENRTLSGVYAAAVTPLTRKGDPDLAALPGYLEFLAQRGCHGALLLGTTGEGPSFSQNERLAIFRAGLQVREAYPKFRLLGGTGTPSLEETIELTKAAFEIGLDGVVTLPPYYYRDATEEGLYDWFSQVLKKATPTNGGFLVYHIPKVSGVALAIPLLARLKERFPERFTGLKDSSGDPLRARQIGKKFGDALLVFTGNDKLFQASLSYHGAGCITAAANLFSTRLRSMWDAHQRGETEPVAQADVEQGRQILEDFRPFGPAIKAVLASHYSLGYWPVRPPLVPLPRAAERMLLKLLAEAGLLD